MSLQDWRMIELSFPTAKRVFAGISSPPSSSQGKAALMERGSDASESNVPRTLTIPDAEQPSLKDFRGLKGKDLVVFAQEKGLIIHEKSLSILEKNSMGADMIGSKSAIKGNLLGAGFQLLEVRRILNWLEEFFPVKVQVQVEDKNPYYLTLGPGNTVGDLFAMLKGRSSVLKNLDFGDVRIMNGSDLFEDPNTTLVPNAKYHFESAAPAKTWQDPIVYLDSVFQDVLKVPPKDEPFIGVGFGKNFPYQGRKELKDAFRKKLVDHFGLKKKNRDTNFLPFICAAPGTGKTRATAEFPAIWKELVQEEATLAQFKDDTFVHLYTTFNSYSPFSPIDQEVGEEASLALRFYFSYFIKRRLHFIEFEQRIKDIATVKQLRLFQVLERIQSETGSKCWFFLVVDDMQQIFGWTYPGRLLTSLATLPYDQNRNENYTALPLLVGTHICSIQRNMSGSSNRTDELRVPMLSEEHQEAIVDSVLAKYNLAGKDKWGGNEKFRRQLKVYGNFPRGLEAILSTYDSLLAEGDLKFHQVSSDAVSRRFQVLCRSEQVSMNVSDARGLLRVWLFQEEVGDDLIPGTNLDISLLECIGYLTRERVVRDGQPKNVIRLLAHGLEVLAKALPIVKQFFLNSTPNDHEFERMIPHFLVLRASLAQPRPRCLKELFPGAKYHPEDLANLWIDPPLGVSETSLHFPELRSEALRTPGEIQCTGDSSQGFNFFYLQTTPGAKEKTAFFINAKRIAGDATAPCQDAFMKTQEILDQEEKPWKDGVVGVITTGKVDLQTALQPPDSELAPSNLSFPKRVFVIDSEGLKTFLGAFHGYF